MAATPADPRSPARRIADDLRDLIEQGELLPGARLPTMRAIQDRYGVSSATANQAFAQLKTAGLVVTRPGSGAFVRERRVVRRDLVAGIRREHERAVAGEEHDGLFEETTGHSADVQISYSRVTDASAAQALQAEPEAELVCREYRYAINGGELYQRFRSYLPVSRVDGTDLADPSNERPGRGTIAQLRDIGVLVDRCELDIESRMPSIDEARDLAIPAGTPVFVHRRVLYAADEPVETGVAVVRSDLTAYTLTIDLGGSS